MDTTLQAAEEYEDVLLNTSFQVMMNRCRLLYQEIARNRRLLVEYHALWDEANVQIRTGELDAADSLHVGRMFGLMEARLMRNYKKNPTEQVPEAHL